MKTLSTSLSIYIYVLQNVLHLCMPRIELYQRMLTQKQLPVLQAALPEQYIQTLLESQMLPLLLQM